MQVDLIYEIVHALIVLKPVHITSINLKQYDYIVVTYNKAFTYLKTPQEFL